MSTCALCQQALEKPHLLCDEISSHLYLLIQPQVRRGREEDGDGNGNSTSSKKPRSGRVIVKRGSRKAKNNGEVPSQKKSDQEEEVPELNLDALKSILFKVPLIDLRNMCMGNKLMAKICTEKIFIYNYVQENLYRFDALLKQLLENEPPLEKTFVKWLDFGLKYGNNWFPSEELFNVAVNRVVGEAIGALYQMKKGEEAAQFLEDVVWKLAMRFDEYNNRQVEEARALLSGLFLKRSVHLTGPANRGYNILETLVKHDFHEELTLALRTADSVDVRNSIIQNTLNPILRAAVTLPTDKCVNVILFDLFYGNPAAERAHPEILYDCIKRGFRAASFKIIQYGEQLIFEENGLIFLQVALDYARTAIIGELLWRNEFPHHELEDNDRIEILETVAEHADKEDELLRVLRYKEEEEEEEKGKGKGKIIFPFAEVATSYPFKVAIEKDYVDCVKLMLYYSLNLDFDQYAWYYVNLAMESGHAEIVDLLMSQDDSPRLTPSRKAKLEEFQRQNELQPKKLDF